MAVEGYAEIYVYIYLKGALNEFFTMIAKGTVLYMKGFLIIVHSRWIFSSLKDISDFSNASLKGTLNKKKSNLGLLRMKVCLIKGELK